MNGTGRLMSDEDSTKREERFRRWENDVSPAVLFSRPSPSLLNRERERERISLTGREFLWLVACEERSTPCNCIMPLVDGSSPNPLDATVANVIHSIVEGRGRKWLARIYRSRWQSNFDLASRYPLAWISARCVNYSAIVHAR